MSELDCSTGVNCSSQLSKFSVESWNQLVPNAEDVDASTSAAVNTTPSAARSLDAGDFIICIVSGLVSLITVLGNVLVAVSFAIDKDLRKNAYNYLLLSLAAADFMVGLVSMNLFTTFIVTQKWTLGSIVCDLWLAIDYVASNASVMNLLIICLDR